MAGKGRRGRFPLPAGGAPARISDDDAVCVVVLDGENPWECYPENGVPFLRDFYAPPRSEPGITPVLPGTISPPTARAERLARPGDLARQFLQVGRGPGQERGWDELAAASAHCGPVPEIYVAEGSDWFWWYGGADKEEFDFLFKRYVRAACRSGRETRP